MKVLESKKFFILTIILGLIGVGISYNLGMSNMPNGLNDLWGETPDQIKPIYFLTTSLAFIGFAFAFFFLVFKTDLFNYYPLSRSAIIILVASMLWLPYTSEMVNSPSSFTWIKIRISLLLVALGSWFFMRRVWLTDSSENQIWKKLALVGSAIFFFHTLIMDALLWPIFFR